MVKGNPDKVTPLAKERLALKNLGTCGAHTCPPEEHRDDEAASAREKCDLVRVYVY